MATHLGLQYYGQVTFELERSEIRSRSANLRRSVWSNGSTLWRFQAKFLDTFGSTRAAAKLSAHMDMVGSETSFDLEIPQKLGIILPDRNINIRAGTYNAGATSINISLPANQTVELGTVFNIFGLNRMYQAVSDVTSGIAGSPNVQLQIRPRLERTITIGAATPLNFDPTMRAYYDSASIHPFTSGSLYQNFIDFIEDKP